MTALEGPADTWPNLFVAGTAKAGTTSLWAHLDAHPDIYMSTLKEPHFFADIRRSAVPVVKDPQAYVRLFAEGIGARYRGEASPSYLPDPHAAERIRAAVGNPRVVVSLREPVERAYAHYWTWVRAGGERRSFADAVRDELGLKAVDMGAEPPPYVARGFYAEQVLRFRQAFGPSLLVLFFEEFVADVRGTMRTVYDWLGLDTDPAESLDPSPRFPFLLPRNRAVALARRIPAARWLGDRLLGSGEVRARIDRAIFSAEKPPLDSGTRRLLRDLYAPEDARLRELLGRALPWDPHE